VRDMPLVGATFVKASISISSIHACWCLLIMIRPQFHEEVDFHGGFHRLPFDTRFLMIIFLSSSTKKASISASKLVKYSSSN